MSSTDRELMQQAFEALEDMMAEFRGYDLPYGSKAYAKAKDARLDLYARLAKPEQKPQAYLDTGLGAFYWSREFPEGPPPGFAPVYIDYTAK